MAASLAGRWLASLLVLGLSTTARAQPPLIDVDVVQTIEGFNVPPQPSWNHGPQPFAYDDSNMAVMDLRNPWGQPVHIPGSVWGLSGTYSCISGNWFFDATRKDNYDSTTDGFVVAHRIDQSPAAERFVSRAITNFGPWGISVDGGICAMVGASRLEDGWTRANIRFLDVSNPGAIRNLGSLRADADKMFMAGGRAFYVRGEMMGSIDISNPAAPVLSESAWPMGQQPVFALPFVYGATSDGNLRVLDMGQTNAPRYKAFAAGSQSIVQIDNTLLVGVYQGTPQVLIDISDPWNPRVAGTLPWSQGQVGFWAFTGRWLFARKGMDIVALDIRNPDDIRSVARFRAISGMHMAAWGPWLYVRYARLGNENRAAVYDIGGIVEPARAAARATVIGGYVVQVDVRRGGEGYTVPPRVRLVSSSGAGAEARAILDAAGRVSSIAIVSPGSGYSADTHVEIETPDRTPRTARAVPRIVNGFIVEWEVTDPGHGYTTPPEVRVSGPHGTGSVSAAELDIDGGVHAIRVLNPGSGYDAATATARVRPPVVPEHSLSLVPGERMARASTILPTSSYEWQRQTLQGWQSMGLPPVANQSSAQVYVGGPDNGAAVRLAELPLPTTAQASPSVVNGFVVGVVLADGGSGYVKAPAVRFLGGGGTGAAATATVLNGKVIRIVMDNPGRGYVEMPQVIVEEPRVRVVPVVVSPALRLDQRNLSLDLEYLLQSSADLKTWRDEGPWQPPSGESQKSYLEISEERRFFRLLRGPW